MNTKEYLELDINYLLELYRGNNSDMIRRHNRIRLLNVTISKIEKASKNKELLPLLYLEYNVNQFVLRKYPEKRFQSQTLYKEDETSFSHPDIESFSNEHIQLLKDEVERVDSVVLKALYFDFLWFKERQLEYALKTIEAYYNLINFQMDNINDFELVDSIDRILSISSEVKNDTELKKVYERAVSICEKLQIENKHVFVKTILMSVLKHSKKLDKIINYEKILELVNSSINELQTENQNQFSGERSLLEVAEEVYKINKNYNDRSNIKLRIAESFISEGNWVKEHRKSNMIAAKFFEDGMKLLISMGGHKNRVEELKVMIGNGNKIAVEQEMGMVSHQWTVEQDRIDEYLIIYKNRTFNEVINILSYDLLLIPSYNKISQDITVRPFDINDILTTTYYDGHRQIGAASTNEEKRKHKINFEFSFNIQYAQHLFLRQIFEIIKEEHLDYKEKILEKLHSSDFIKENRIFFIEKGLEYYKNEDYFAAINSLIFQVEGVLRDMIVELGGVDFSYRDGRMKLRTLPDLLSELQKHPSPEEQDFFKFIEYYLTEYGFNYRNKVAHADIEIGNFNRAIVEYLVLIFLRISTYKKIKKVK